MSNNPLVSLFPFFMKGRTFLSRIKVTPRIYGHFADILSRGAYTVGEKWAFNHLLSRWGLSKTELIQRGGSGGWGDAELFLWVEDFGLRLSLSIFMCSKMPWNFISSDVTTISVLDQSRILQNLASFSVAWNLFCKSINQITDLLWKWILINACYFPNRKWQTAWAMEDPTWYLMEEYNQGVKEFWTFLRIFMRQGNTKRLGDKMKTFFAFVVSSPEHPLKLFSICLIYFFSFFIGWKTSQKCSRTVISTGFPDCSKEDFPVKKRGRDKTDS